MARDYPRIGSVGARPKWLKAPANAPFCIAPGCKCRATNRPEIEVSWFRGDDERAGPVCKEHSRAEPVTLLLWTAAWKASQQKPAPGVPGTEAPRFKTVREAVAAEKRPHIRAALETLADLGVLELTDGVMGTEAPSDDAEFEMHGRDGVMLAGTSGARAVAWAELMRYAAQYDAEEGPLTFYEVTRKPVCAPGVPAGVRAAPPSVASSNTERVVFKCDNPGGCRFPKQPCLASCSLTVSLAPTSGVGASDGKVDCTQSPMGEGGGVEGK